MTWKDTFQTSFYELTLQKHKLDINQALSIDLGTADNLAACVDTLGNSLLIDARAMKAMNQLWNKKVATRKEGKPQAYWDNWLDLFSCQPIDSRNGSFC